MTSSHTTPPDLASARARNESTWRASAVALYAGDIDEFLAHWSAEPRYAVAYPVEGFPSVVEGREQLRVLFSGFAAAAARIDVTDVRVHQTDDPDVVFVEEHMTAQLHGGMRYQNDMVIRVTFRDGLIHDMFEYYGQAAHQRLADTVLAAAQAS
ncbi:nuclear transport factor 2 family protein [Nocardioides sp. LHG3406-4]|uniref:nuclear transport factor 2 family protein n=1 Tax=Nocardioides sp. LHG3406-4 TaxID=2804575 RepID=UPI003CF0F6DC